MLKGQYNQKGISNIITATDAGTILELPIKEGGSVMARGTLHGQCRNSGGAEKPRAGFGREIFSV